MTTILAQRDPMWGSVTLGYLKQLTIYWFGCTTCALAMVNNKFGANCTPDQVADHLDWYTPDGLILWPKLNLQHAVFEANGREYGYNVARVKSSLESNEKAVILEVPIQKGLKHWLCGDTIDEHGTIWAFDPWFGDRCDILKRYGHITGSAHFTKRIILTPTTMTDEVKVEEVVNDNGQLPINVETPIEEAHVEEETSAPANQQSIVVTLVDGTKVNAVRWLDVRTQRETYEIELNGKLYLGFQKSDGFVELI